MHTHVIAFFIRLFLCIYFAHFNAVLLTSIEQKQQGAQQRASVSFLPE